MPDDIWLLGLALGLAVDAGLLLGLVLSGAPVRLPDDLPRLATIGAAVAALGWTGLPVLVGLVRGGWAAVWAWKMRPWAQVADDAALDRHAAPPHATREEPRYAREEQAQDEPDVAADWRAAAHRFLVAGDRYGFGVRVLYPMGFVTWDDWGIMLKFLAEAGILVRKPAAGWAEDWNLERWYEKGHSFPLPYREEGPPKVALSPTTPTPNRPQQASEVIIHAEKG